MDRTEQPDRRDPSRQTRRREGRRLTDLTDPDYPYITIEQVAAYLHVSNKTVWKWIGAGSLPAYQFEERITRVKATELQAFIEAQRLGQPGQSVA
jgi:excisionase family DNA binding protein